MRGYWMSAADMAQAEELLGALPADFRGKFARVLRKRKKVQSLPRGLGVIERISDWVYDRKAVASLTEYDFFKDVSGKTDTDTNLKTGGQIPFTESLYVDKIGIHITPIVRGFTVAEFGTYIPEVTDGNWRIMIGNKNYQQGNLDMLANYNVHCCVQPRATAPAAEIIYGSLNNPFVRAKGAFYLKSGFKIQPGETFSVEVHWDTAPNASNPFKLVFYLFGERRRTVQ